MRLILLGACALAALAPGRCPAESLDEYVKRSQRARVVQIQALREQIQAAKAEAITGASAWTDELRRLENALVEILDPTHPYHAPLGAGRGGVAVGAIGSIVDRYPRLWRVIDAENSLVALRNLEGGPYGAEDVAWIKGVKAESLATRSPPGAAPYAAPPVGPVDPGPLRVTGTKQYQHQGETRIAFVLEPLEIPAELWTKYAALGVVPGEEPPRPPGKAEPAASEPPAVRVWTDASGRYTVRASFRGLVNGRVRLRTEDGRDLAVPLERISAADREWIDGKTP